MLFITIDTFVQLQIGDLGSIYYIMDTFVLLINISIKDGLFTDVAQFWFINVISIMIEGDVILFKELLDVIVEIQLESFVV